ncbi:MAG: hypoxanthine phosphoribosyltransferase [Dehalococcoidia bacterium]|jgi:hypoxanthine phosphoribosyltransferase|nr:hypoxanthine phosphoribosyltransferase [Dehalococcoidia bacterium]
MAKKAQRAKGQDARPPEPFAHPAEAELARILDFYGIRWEYEPHSFPLRWEGDRVVEAFTPDFYLPDLDLYVEVTTLRGGLNTEKNRKVRLLRQLYPQVRVKLLKRRDVFRLLAKYGYGPLGPDDMPELDRVLIPPQKLQERVAELAKAIEEDYRHLEPVLVGVLRGVICFMADLMRQLTIPITVDFLAISSYGQGGAVRILKDLDEDVRGRHVLLVEDIVDTGITLRKVLDHLEAKGPASLRVCALLDKRARRLVDIPLHYVGFEIPDEFVVGYGLDFRQRYRNLPFIAIVKHHLLA